MANKDDLVAEAVNLGLGKDIDLLKLKISELQKLIAKAKEPVPVKHKFWRG